MPYGIERILEAKPELTVDLHTPDFVLNVDVREDGDVYVYDSTVKCAGGMPYGTGGNGLLLLTAFMDCLLNFSQRHAVHFYIRAIVFQYARKRNRFWFFCQIIR